MKEKIEIAPEDYVTSPKIFRIGNTLYRGISEVDIATPSVGVIAKLLDPSLGVRDPRFERITVDWEKFHNAGLVSATISNFFSEEFPVILELETIDFISYYPEWSSAMRMDAALMMLDLQKALIENGLCIFDGHYFNVLFDYTRPVFIDHHSIVNLSLNLAWYPEFFGLFMRPFFTTAEEGDTFWKDLTDRTISDVEKRKDYEGFQEMFLQLIDEARNKLASFEVTAKTTPWSGYPLTSNEPSNNKERVPDQLLRRLYVDGMTVIDFGANRGWFSKLASRIGYRVVAVELDDSCMTELYLDGKQSSAKILPLVGNFLIPTPVTGKHLKMYDRLRCDISLSMALVHHLVFAQRADFPTIASLLDKFTKTHAIVEFPSENDGYVKSWLLSEHNHQIGMWYNIDNLIKEMSVYFTKHEIFDSYPKGRQIILFSR